MPRVRSRSIVSWGNEADATVVRRRVRCDTTAFAIASNKRQLVLRERRRTFACGSAGESVSGATVTSFGNPGAIHIGKYRLIAELGHGGMSDVYLAVAKGMAGFRKLLVIKQLRPNLAEDEEFLAMFLDEARLAARLSHRNVVATHEVGEDDGRYYIAMEYLEGQALKRIVHRAKDRFERSLHLHVILEVLKGLHYAHELCDFDGTPLGVVHRDVSPHNVFVTYGGDVKVVDFGVAKALDSSTETSAGVMKGKLAYMSPEQARGSAVDRRADIFSVGVILWECLTGKRMWAGQTSSRIAERLVGGDIPDIRLEASDVPDGLAGICERALSCDLDRRYATALEMHDALQAFVEGQHEQVRAETLGARVEKLFADERLLMQTIVERQLSRIQASQGSDVPAVGMVTLGRITTGSKTPSSRSERTLDRSHSSRAAVASDKRADLGASRLWKGGVAVALTTAAAVAAVFVLSRVGGNDEATTSALPAPAAASVSPGDRESKEVLLRISVRPTSARLFLDGVRLPSNPFERSVRVDETTHRVRAEADGFATETRDVRFESDVLIHFTLAPSKDASPAQTTSSPKSVGTRPPAEPALPGPPATGQPAEPGTAPTKRPLDPKDPWTP